MDLIFQVVATVFNSENATINNIAFVVGGILSVGLIVFGILSIIFGTFLSFVIILAITGFFGFRMIATNEAVTFDDRSIASPKSF